MKPAREQVEPFANGWVDAHLWWHRLQSCFLPFTNTGLCHLTASISRIAKWTHQQGHMIVLRWIPHCEYDRNFAIEAFDVLRHKVSVCTKNQSVDTAVQRKAARQQ